MRKTGLPRPFLKWAGGKSQLADEILRHLPKRIATYYEPFVGSGAIFFRLHEEGRFERAVLSDFNGELIQVYEALRDDVEQVIQELGEHLNEEKYYYEVRAADPSTLSKSARAARLIFLNKTGYNGLYRVNSKGEFNVPFGRYKRPPNYDPDNLRAVSDALQNAELRRVDFQEAVAEASRGDAVYFDPPYIPLSRTSSFTSYSPFRFDLEQHQRLAGTFDDLRKRGVRAVLSNSSAPEARDLYARFDCREVDVRRPINSRGDRRGEVKELLVVNRARRSPRKPHAEPG